MKRIAPVTSILSALLLGAGVVAAQPFGGGIGPGAGPAMGPRWAAADTGAFVDARLANMKSLLGITSSQDETWQAFAAQMKNESQARQALRVQMWTSDANGPDRMALRAQVMQQHAAQMQDVATAFDRLYALLTPEQRAVADQLVAPRHNPRRSGW